MNLILSPISVDDLINQIAAEIERRTLNRIAPSSPPPPNPAEPIRLYGDRAGAAYLGCSIMTIQKLRKRGSVPFYRTGRKVFYLSNELDEALKVNPRKFYKQQSV